MEEEGTVNNCESYRLYFKGLIREERRGEGLLAGYGVAICREEDDNIMFQMKGSLDGSAITVLEVELMALKRGLTEAVRFGIAHISIYCYCDQVFKLVTGRSTPEQEKIALMMDDVQRIRQELTSSVAVLVIGNQVDNFFAMETLIYDEISICMPPGQTCHICFDDDKVDEMMFAVDLCHHQFCVECVKRHIEVRLLEGSAVIRCPHYQCDSELTLTRCAHLLKPKPREMWEQRIQEGSIPVWDRDYCPNPKCSVLMSKTKTKEEAGLGVRRSCFKCGEPFCINCKVPWHNNMSCNDYKMLHPAAADDIGKLIFLANQKMWRQCENCKQMIQRSFGCDHITCRCGYSFCYICGTQWDLCRDHGQRQMQWSDYLFTFLLFYGFLYFYNKLFL